jgi:hypothetical protein
MNKYFVSARLHGDNKFYYKYFDVSEVSKNLAEKSATFAIKNEIPEGHILLGIDLDLSEGVEELLPLKPFPSPSEISDWKIIADLKFGHEFLESYIECLEDDPEWEKFDEVEIIMTPADEYLFCVSEDQFNSTNSGVEVIFQVEFEAFGTTLYSAKELFFDALQRVEFSFDNPFNDEIWSTFEVITAIHIWSGADHSAPNMALDVLSIKTEVITNADKQKIKCTILTF